MQHGKSNRHKYKNIVLNYKVNYNYLIKLLKRIKKYTVKYIHVNIYLKLALLVTGGDCSLHNF